VWTLRGVFEYVFRGAKMRKVGEPAPEFEVKDHRGRKVRLGDLRGSKVVLWFYPKADTPG